MEIIVFNQEELQRALAAGCKSICLCDNEYEIPASDGAAYMSVGQVKAAVCADRLECESLGMKFLNFTPEYRANVFVPLRHSGLVNAGSFVTSAGSYSSGYRLSGSYQIAGSYRIAGSYSYAASFWYVTSFASSFRAGIGGSSAGISGSSAGMGDNDSRVIAVFGYGIDLI